MVTIQVIATNLCHEWFEVHFMRLTHDPVCVATEGPAGNGAHQGLLVTETANQVRGQLRQVRDHSIHAALGDGTQNQDSGLLDLPVGMEQCLLQDRQQCGQDLLTEHIGQNIQGGSRTLPCKDNNIIQTIHKR